MIITGGPLPGAAPFGSNRESRLLLTYLSLGVMEYTLYDTNMPAASLPVHIFLRAVPRSSWLGCCLPFAYH
jgi:hypothetical protein